MARVAIIAGLASSLVNFRGPLIDALIKAGHEVSALAPIADPKTLEWLAARGIPFTEISMARAGMSPAGDLRTLFGLIKLLGQIKPDVVLAYTIKPVIYGMLAASIVGVPRRYAIITGLGYAFTAGKTSTTRRLIGYIAQRLYRVALRRADGVLFQNPDDMDAFRKFGLLKPGSLTAIVNGSGVDTNHFSPVPLPNKPIFLLIARLVADKGIAEYIAAARVVKRNHPDAEFHLVGPVDPNPAALDFDIVRSAVSGGILTYHGEMQDVRPAIAAASVYVLPSYREGTPRSVLEAMAMGRPIITTDAPGCKETVRHGSNGLLVPVKAVDDLADAMSFFINRPELRSTMGAASREVAMEKYQAEDVAQDIISACAL